MEAGAVKATLSCALPGVAVPMVGAPGTVMIVKVMDLVPDRPASKPLKQLNALSVTVTLPLTKGVPETVPVEVFKDRPLGRVPIEME